jgi:iron complex outermembrane receptor protein
VTAFGSQRTFDNVSQLFGSIYFTEGQTNTGIPNFSEATLYEVPLDLNNDGIPDVDFTDYWITNEDGGTNLLPDRERISVMSYGEYTFSGDMNLTPYYEANYNKREFFALSLGAVIQQEAPANNPFNPINPNGLNGVDIGQAYNSVVNNPSYIEDFGLYYEGLCARFGFPLEACTPSLFGLVIPGDGSIGAFPLEAQFSVRGDRDFVQTEVDQTRVVAGLKGDLPMFSAGDFDNWSFDLAFVYNDARGTSLRRGINEEKLIYSLETSVIVPGTSDVVCGTDTDGDGIPDSGDCVPVNMYAPSLYQSLLSNEFASQAERDYLFSDRTFVTDYKQTTANLLLTGDLFSLPAGTVAAALGYEYRSDEIDSIPNDVARDGLLWGYFRDLGAVGEKDTKEWFAEVEVPIFANESRIKELTMNLSTRHTDDEFYGGAWTYSGKLAWRPVDNLLFRGTVGTSYRAPNLRENFLLGTSGFLSLADPCVVPEEALVLSPEGIVYDPEKDTRTQVVLNNCVADGTDPTSLGRLAGGATTPVYGVEILRSVGDTALDEEKSESWTVGLSWDEQIFRNLDVSVGLTYYEIEIINEIVSRSSQGSINSCYGDAEGDSPFCRNIDREALPGGGFGLISEVRENFLNRDGLKTRGLDINVALDLPTQMFGRAVDFGLDLSFNRKYEFSDVFIDTETGTVSRDSDLGEFGLPKWEGQGILRADIGDFRLTWSTRYLSSVEADPDLVELLPFGNVDDGASWTCLGPDNGDVNCRPVYFADKYFRHDMSIYYYGDTWTFGIGARNVTDQAPPLVDGRAVFSGWNVPYGNGYDVNGRQYFANVAVRFDSLTF